MTIQNKQTLKRFTYTCLSLSSILLSSEAQAGGCFSKSSSGVVEDNTSNNYRRHRPSTRPQREIGNEEGFLPSAIKLRQKMENRAKKEDNLFDKVIGATISMVAPKMKDEEKTSLVKAITDILED